MGNAAWADSERLSVALRAFAAASTSTPACIVLTRLHRGDREMTEVSCAQDMAEAYCFARSLPHGMWQQHYPVSR